MNKEVKKALFQEASFQEMVGHQLLSYLHISIVNQQSADSAIQCQKEDAMKELRCHMEIIVYLHSVKESAQLVDGHYVIVSL